MSIYMWHIYECKESIFPSVSPQASKHHVHHWVHIESFGIKTDLTVQSFKLINNQLFKIFMGK